MLILTYHSISDGPPPLCTTADRFAEQLDFLLGAGLEPVALRDALERHASGEAPPADRFALTFDDGYRDFSRTALPLLEARSLPVTLFAVVTEERERLAGGTEAPLLELGELRELAQRGVELGAHGVAHTDLTALDDDALERELALGRQRLAELAGAPVEALAYPFGRFDERVRRAAARHFRFGVTTQLARVSASADPLALPRVDAYYLDSTLLRSGLSRGGGEAYLWARRWLRRIRGSEPRRPLPGRPPLRPTAAAPEGAELRRMPACR
jgi:peptidoglycan/xylan/chitin deacetylase (PgdA/CDA1 family)